MAVRADLTSEDKTIWIGDDAIIQCTLDTNASITGWTFDFVLKVSQSNASAVVDDSDAGISIAINDAGSASTPGVIDVTITDDVTDTLIEHDYWYALRRKDSGAETTLVHGIWRSRHK